MEMKTSYLLGVTLQVKECLCYAVLAIKSVPLPLGHAAVKTAAQRGGAYHPKPHKPTWDWNSDS